MADLLPCPFCGRSVDLDDCDTLYPSGTYWREDEGFRHYVSHRERRAGDGRCWTMHCPTTGGGCGAQITADSEPEVRAAWNRRAVIPTGPAAAPSHRATVISSDDLAQMESAPTPQAAFDGLHAGRALLAAAQGGTEEGAQVRNLTVGNTDLGLKPAAQQEARETCAKCGEDGLFLICGHCGTVPGTNFTPFEHGEAGK